MKITITNTEQKIFDMILSCKPSNVIPRVAGGWVRDKLMGISSYDMDIALENISGYNFAILLESSFKNSVSSVSLIQSNPDKSKHLETAVCKINGMMIDFVNLRCEKYTDTRIPIITIGTAEEDSYRRDLTINSLFYNLVTRNIEDHTGLGFQDIQNKVLRTPLDPLTTFSDDPLRILRIFRFRSKLNFMIQNDIYAALKNKSLKIHLKQKVSKERIHIEIFKMIDNNYGHEGIYELINNEYIETVFGLENNIQEMKNFYQKICQKSIESNLDKRWIYNLYIVFLSSSACLIQDKKKFIFLNVKICRDELCSSSKICTTIRCIEEGIYRCKMFDFIDLSLYNIYFVLNILGTYWYEILYFEYIKKGNENIKKFVDFLQENNIKYIENDKPIIDIKNIDQRLSIDKKYINYFVKECLIYQQSIFYKDKILNVDELVNVDKLVNVNELVNVDDKVLNIDKLVNVDDKLVNVNDKVFKVDKLVNVDKESKVDKLVNVDKKSKVDDKFKFIENHLLKNKLEIIEKFKKLEINKSP